jgi:hypothetical protein
LLNCQMFVWPPLNFFSSSAIDTLTTWLDYTIWKHWMDLKTLQWKLFAIWCVIKNGWISTQVANSVAKKRNIAATKELYCTLFNTEPAHFNELDLSKTLTGHES